VSAPLWSEWDGRGHSDAVAWAAGWLDDDNEILQAVRRLGVDVKDIRLLHGWSGYVDGDVIPDACDEAGRTLDDPLVSVDESTMVPTTYVFTVVW
jgi:hypothetical protein